LVNDYDTTTVERKNNEFTPSNRDVNAKTKEPSEPSFPSTPRQPSLSDPESDPVTQEPSLRLLDVDQYLDDQANHLLFLPARPWWLCHPDVELEMEVEILLDASHSGHRVDHIRGVLQKLDSQIDGIPIEDESFSVDVLIRPVPVVLSSEIPIPGDLMEQELAMEEDLERGARTHASIHDTEENPHPSNFVAAYQSPQPRSVLVLCGVDKAGLRLSFRLWRFSWLVLQFCSSMLSRNMILGQEQAFVRSFGRLVVRGMQLTRKFSLADEDGFSERELELQEVSRRSA
jgi:hypothetical protein